MLHLPLTILPALLFGVTGALAANTNIQPTTNMAAAGGITHHILLPDTSTSISTTTRSTAQPSPTPDTNTNTNLAQTTNPNTGPGVFNSAIQHSRSHRRRCRRPPLTCDCSKNATELAALNALRAEHKCGNWRVWDRE
ncbi:uncharacterized protein B0H64DRAFT_378814 [Chaetomium fimeti]|uniref:Uncharacterized protein n=1 Tax=Chaetomium fimeti TaxID=1854472 RepID=A0AAE0LLX7_9PEZI|nr:hypothetical protein B0H64DRAFT_378814 [Chaetomium fimeti]